MQIFKDFWKIHFVFLENTFCIPALCAQQTWILLLLMQIFKYIWKIFKDIWKYSKIFRKYSKISGKYSKIFGKYSKTFGKYALCAQQTWILLLMQLFKDFWKINFISRNFVFHEICHKTYFPKMSTQACCVHVYILKANDFSIFLNSSTRRHVENFPGGQRWKIWYFRQNKMIAQGTDVSIRWMNIFMSLLQKIARENTEFEYILNVILNLNRFGEMWICLLSGIFFIPSILQVTQRNPA